MIRLQLFVLGLVSLLLCTGCVEKMTGNLSGKNIDQPVLENVNKEHKKAILAIGAEQDRLQEQSRGFGLVAADSFENYANNILERLKIASGVENIPGQIYLVAENAWSAKASADGNIYIPIGMLGDINSEDVFAALLAHELSHAILNHTDSDMFVKVSKKSVYATSFVNRLSGTVDKDSDAYLTSLGAFAASELFLSPSWTRGQETEADLMGLDILVRAGYSANAMEVLLETVEVLDERNRLELERRREEMKAASERVRNEAILNLDYATYMKSALGDSFNLVKGKMQRFMATHDSGSDRLAAVREYKKQHYRRLPRKNFSTDAWHAALNTEEIKQIVMALDKTYLAYGYLMKSEAGQGSEVISSSISQSTEKQNYVRKVFAEIRAAQGKRTYALQNHQIALTGKYPSFESHKIILNDAILKAEKQRLKVGYFDHLMTQFDTYGRPPEYFRDMVVLAENLQLKDKAAALKAECNIKYAGDGVSCSREQDAEENTLSFRRFF